MSEANTNNYRDDEIDLRKLLQSIGNGIKNVGKSIINLIIWIRRISIRYKFLIISMVLIGGIVGIFFNKTNKPFYNTSMLLSSEYFNARLVENNIEKLNNLCGEEDRLGLAKLLGIENSIATNIKGFAYEPLVSEEDIVDVEILKQKLEELKVKDPDIAKVINQIQIQNKKTYVITVHVFDNIIIGDLQESVVEYFKNSPFVKNRIAINKNNQLKLISKLENDLSQLDSLKDLFNLNLKADANRKGKSSASSNVYVGESSTLDPTRFYSQSVSLYRQLQATQKQVELGDDFEVIDGFTAFAKPESPSWKDLAISSGAMFLGIAYMLIFLIESNKYLNRIEKDGFKN